MLIWKCQSSKSANIHKIKISVPINALNKMADFETLDSPILKSCQSEQQKNL